MAKFYAYDMGVRFDDGKPLCVTSHSIHLDRDPDPSVGYVEKTFENRQAWARLIAKALNAYFEKHPGAA